MEQLEVAPKGIALFKENHIAWMVCGTSHSCFSDVMILNKNEI
jgi:hypothetical protein